MLDTTKRLLIAGIFITSLVVANVVTGKLLDLGGLIVPGAFLLYAFTFLCTDIYNELYGRKEAQKLVNIGFVTSIFASIMILLTMYLPVYEGAAETQEAYEVLLGPNIRFVFASMVAYYLSQTLDVYVFDRIGKKTKGKHKWIRNNVSTLLSQLVDTAIFITIAFMGGPAPLLVMIGSQFLVKMFVAIADTPVFYLITKNHVNKAYLE